VLPSGCTLPLTIRNRGADTILAPRTNEGLHDRYHAGTYGRIPWATLVVGTLAAMAALLVALEGGAAGAREAPSVDLDVDRTVPPGTVQVNGRRTIAFRITNGGSIRAERVTERVRMRAPLSSRVRFIRATTSREGPGSCGIETGS
jgi:hypothetical protein